MLHEDSRKQLLQRTGAVRMSKKAITAETAMRLNVRTKMLPKFQIEPDRQDLNSWLRHIQRMHVAAA